MLRLIITGKDLDQFFMYLDVQEMKNQSSYVQNQKEMLRFVVILMIWDYLVQTVFSLKLFQQCIVTAMNI